MKSIEKLSDMELLNYILKLEEKENKTKDDYDLYTMMLNYLSQRKKLERKNARIDLLDGFSVELVDSIRKLDHKKYISKRRIKKGNIIMSNFMGDNIYAFNKLSSYKNDVSLDNTIYAKYDEKNPFHFEELVTGTSIPISFSTYIKDPDKMGTSKSFCNILKLPYWDTTSIGGNTPDSLSVRVSVGEGTDRIVVNDGVSYNITDDDVSQYMTTNPRTINHILNRVDRKGLEEKYKDLSDKKIKKLMRK